VHLLVDSAGIEVESEGEWHARKNGGPKRRVWRKLHHGIDEDTLEIRAVEITGSHIGDAPVLPDLLSQIPEDQEIGSVTADGAYDTRKCHDAIADRGAHAIIPPRRNAKPWRAITAGAMARDETLRAAKYLDRALWRRWSGYHCRSRVETRMRETARPAAHGTGLRPQGCRDPGPHRRPDQLHRARHPGHGGRGISLSGEGATSPIT